CLQGYSSPSSL
nr:immunoglobulin light chain junction region [Macaca mulatta]